MNICFRRKLAFAHPLIKSIQNVMSGELRKQYSVRPKSNGALMTFCRINHMFRSNFIISNSSYCNQPKQRQQKLNPYEIFREELKLTEQFLDKKHINFNEIDKVCKEYGTQARFWQTYCMDHFHHTNDINHGIKLMEYLEKHSSQKISLKTLTLFIALTGSSGHQYQNLVYTTFEKVLKITDVFDMSSIKYLIQGFCGTDNWRKSLEFLEMEKFQSTTKNAGIRSPIIIKALYEGDMSLAMKILQELAAEGNEPSQRVFVEMVEMAENKTGTVTIDTLLDLLREKRWYPDENTALKIKNYFLGLQGEEWQCLDTHIKNDGVCPCCGVNLPIAKFNPSDFENLKKDIMEKLIVASNVFHNSSPVEIKRFIEFLNTHGPFDVVIDGLNIGLCKTPLNPGVKLRLAVEYFTSKGKKVLVIGKQHMKNWKKESMRRIQEQAMLFYVDNISEDDPFILYAACHSGENTMIVTRDFLHNHSTRIGVEYQQLFNKWLQCRKIPKFIYTKSGEILIWEPNGHEIEPFHTTDSWHIPYRYEDGFKWLCLVK
ncbi:hypothetical protein SNE40_009421 [Patella caerulea]|uniref:Mitochondrial ribonuclease P catalytic subunit n=2 Tax=Patella caerulea TaxID=87958 RepID=A0AAN8JZ11_PATCE